MLPLLHPFVFVYFPILLRNTVYPINLYDKLLLARVEFDYIDDYIWLYPYWHGNAFIEHSYTSTFITDHYYLIDFWPWF